MNRTILVLSGVLLVASPLPAQWNATLEAARQEARVGAFDAAGLEFERALQQAPDEPTRVEIIVEFADSVAGSAEGRATSEPLNAQAAELYKRALQTASGALRVRAINNYGALLIRQGKADGAVTVLEGLKDEPTLKGDGPSYARYLYNLARAYELAGKADEARLRYEESARADDTFAPPAKAVLRVLHKQPATAERMAVAGTWLNVLVERGDLSLAVDGLSSTFARPAWTSHASFPHILRALMIYLTVSRTEPAAFEATWAPRLRKLPEEPPTSRAIGKELIAIYLKDLPVTFEAEAADHLFNRSLTQLPAGNADARVILSRLLKVVGDTYAEGNKPQMALQRYALGSAVDLHGASIDASLHAANLLLWNGEQLDQSDVLLNQLVGRLFDAKGAAYVSRDWDDILRLHTVLGTIFEGRKAWGSEANARSAIFQFDHALRAYDHLSAGPEPPAPVNGVRISLGKSYDGAQRHDDAARLFLDAAEDAIARHNREVVEEALKETERLRQEHSLSKKHMDRLKELRAKAEDWEKEANPLPEDTVEIDLADVANQELGKTACLNSTNNYRRVVAAFGPINARTRVIETERRGSKTAAEIGIASNIDRPQEVHLLLCVTQISDDVLKQAVELGKLRFEFASGPPLHMPIADINADPAWIRLAGTEAPDGATYLRPLIIPLRKPFSAGRLLRIVLIDESRSFDSADPGLILIKALVNKRA